MHFEETTTIDDARSMRDFYASLGYRLTRIYPRAGGFIVLAYKG